MNCTKANNPLIATQEDGNKLKGGNMRKIKTKKIKRQSNKTKKTKIKNNFARF